MYDRFGPGTIDIIRKMSAGDYDRDDIERYITELVSDYSRSGTASQSVAGDAEGLKNDAPAEDGQGTYDEELVPESSDSFINELQELTFRVKGYEQELLQIRRLQENLRSAESEGEELSARLHETEQKSMRSEEDLRTVLNEKRETEDRNRMLEAANEAALGRTETLKSVSDKLRDEPEDRFESGGSSEDCCSEGDDGCVGHFGYASSPDSMGFEEKYGSDLITDSGRELFMMLQGLLRDDTRDDNGVRMTKSWEEELEETIPGMYPDEPSITRRVRTKSEVTVEYMSGHNNGI